MTTFTSPLIIEGANNPKLGTSTDTSGFVHCTKIVPLTGAAVSPRAIVTLPPFSILTNARAYATSAFAADVSAMNVSFGNSSDATRYGIIAVSALGQIRGATVSAANDFNNQTGGTMVIVGSAVSTATFTAGGANALVEYIVVG
jgi:hypothetical protein